MTQSFVKYQGLGNDFILIDNMQSDNPIFSSEQAKTLCNRNYGIGADGVIFALPGLNNCNYTMRIYNSDGSEPQMCGNGIRCMAKFLQLIEDRKSNEEVVYKIWTNAGVITPTVTPDGLVTVDMGEPILDPIKIPSSLQPNKEVLINNATASVAVDAKVDIYINNSTSPVTIKTTPVSMGNPHAVTFVEELSNMVPPFRILGPAVSEFTHIYPERVNAEFVQVHNRSHVRVEVWERGAGSTLACGTGACAVVVAGVLTNRTDRRCKVSLPGGDLIIHWSTETNRVHMTGPAEEVFRGQLSLAL